MPDFYTQLERARGKITHHLGKVVLLNGVEIKAPIITSEASAKMGGYRHQPLSEKIILLTEQQAQTTAKGMTLQDGTSTYTLAQDPVPRTDGFYGCALREVFA